MEEMPEVLAQENVKNKIFEIKKIQKEATNDKIYEQKADSNPKKYRLLSFKKIKEIVKKLIKNTQLTETNIKEFHKIFKLSDIEPNINYQYLSYLKKNSIKKFDKYINKYLYTLNYNEAKTLVNLESQVNKEINKLKQFRLNNNIKSDINKIDSLSKIKLVNFIYQINDYYKKRKEMNDYKDLFLEYKLNTNLKYRLPNSYGNTELIFYTYLQLFFDLFYFENEETIMEIDEEEENIKKDNKEEDINKINNNEDSDSEEECFSLSDCSFEENKSIDYNNEEITRDINDFCSFINNNNKNNNKIEENKIDEVIPIEKNYRKSLLYLRYLNGFDYYIEKRMLIDYEKNDFLDKIEFIFFTIIYFIYNNKGKVDFDRKFIKYALYEPENIRKESIKVLNLNKTDKAYLKTLNQETKESLIYTYLITSDIPIKNVINNPFENCSNYYKFPLNMTKNIILFDNEFFNELKKFILQVYESKLFKEIFYITEEFKDFLYPFEGEEKDNIFSEMFEITKFYPFELDNLYGYTNKILPRIIISSLFKDCSSIERIIGNFAYLLNTLFHEQMKHYIKALIYYNSLRLNLSFSLVSDKPLKEETFEKYYNIVKKKKELLDVFKVSNDEIREIKQSDGGDKLEILLYGQKLQHIYISAALYLLDIDSYNKSISEHLIEFLEINMQAKKMIELDEARMQKLPLLQKIIDLVNKCSLNKRISRLQLDGNFAMQVASSATQVSGFVFTEFKSVSVRSLYGTS